MDDTPKKTNIEKEIEKTSYTPREIVHELDRYIVGQNDAKKAVAIALRNRWRRQRVPENLREEILPKNILMIGPTGVGKTEISRRLAKLAQAPFLKVEATKFTEVGYVGRDVDQIIRDLMQIAIGMTQERLRKKVKPQAEFHAEERVLDALVGKNASLETKSKFRAQLRSGKLDKKIIELDLLDTGSGAMPTFDVPGMPGSQVGMINLNEILLLSNDKKEIKIGTPLLKGISVKAKVLEQKKGKKVIVFKKKRRKNYKKTIGHRQNFTVLKILKIDFLSFLMMSIAAASSSGSITSPALPMRSGISKVRARGT